jgi:hypothetical protein
MVAPPAHVDATSASFSQTGRLTASHRVDTGLEQSSTSLEFHGPTAFPDPRALFLHFPFRKRPRNLRDSPKVPSSGFGYPLDGVSHPNPWRSLSISNALGLCPSELSSFSVVNRVFRADLSALAFFHETRWGLAPTLQRVAPTEKAVPTLLLPGGLVRGRTTCSHGLSDLLGFLRSPAHAVSLFLTT